MRRHRPPHGETVSHRCRHHDPTDQPSKQREEWLLPGETLHAETVAHAWRYLAMDVPYDHRTILFGGPIGWTVSAIASAIGNRRTRQAAERLSAPQWRYLGRVPVIATSDRFLVWYEAAWWPVWLDAVASFELADGSMNLAFDQDAPLRFAGDDLGAFVQVLPRSRREAGGLVEPPESAGRSWRTDGHIESVQ